MIESILVVVPMSLIGFGFLITFLIIIVINQPRSLNGDHLVEIIKQISFDGLHTRTIDSSVIITLVSIFCRRSALTPRF